MESGSIRRISQRAFFALLFTLVVVVIVLLLPDNKRVDSSSGIYRGNGNTEETNLEDFNYTYPLTPPTKSGNVVTFQIGVVADQDQNSKDPEKAFTWFSILKKGVLHYDGVNSVVTVDWSDENKLSTHISEKGRGSELSELLVYNGKLLTVDDRSGLIYEIQGSKLIPWVKLNDGPGNVPKGFKGEWMTIKDNHVYVGGIGKEWTTQSGEFVNDHPQYIKQINSQGHVTHWPWADRYKALMTAAYIKPPGYLIHESACWSSIHKKWFFLPRRASKESYNDIDDEHRGTNILITADESFNSVQSRKITKWNQYRGFSSFKFIPGTRDRAIVALKSEEIKGVIKTYILAFDLNGQILMKETKIGDYKFEGIEFL